MTVLATVAANSNADVVAAISDKIIAVKRVLASTEGTNAQFTLRSNTNAITPKLRVASTGTLQMDLFAAPQPCARGEALNVLNHNISDGVTLLIEYSVLD